MRILMQGMIGLVTFIMSFWLAIYWLFVPSRLTIEAPIANPPGWLVVIAAILALPVLIYAHAIAQKMGDLLPKEQVKIVYIWSRRLALITDFAAILSLFSWLFGIFESNSQTILIYFIIFSTNSLFRMLKIGIGGRSAASEQDLAQFKSLSADQVFEQDKRPPILYLRSFEQDIQTGRIFDRFEKYRNLKGTYLFAWASAEEFLKRDFLRLAVGSRRSSFDEQMIFADYFSHFGPYVAAGRPGEGLESMDLGAAKLFFSYDNWREGITELISRSAAVVIEAADTESLGWEISEVVRILRPRRLLLILPRKLNRYRRFYNAFRPAFPQGLPYDPPRSRLMMFGDDWSPLPLENNTMILSDALAPFLEASRLDAVRLGDESFPSSSRVGASNIMLKNETANDA